MAQVKPLAFKRLFEEESCIGKGSFGTVCKVKTKVDLFGIPKGTVAAIKLIDKKKLDLEQLTLLENEVNILRVVSALKNKCQPNILCYYGTVLVVYGSTEYFGILTEFIDGYQLSRFIDSLGLKEVDPLSQTTFRPGYDLTDVMTDTQIADLMKQLLSALSYMHSLDIVHRDIKSDNIMYIPDKMILKYIDFGFACYDVIGKVRHQCKLKSAGTPLYISPEMWKLASNKPRSIQDLNDTEILMKSDVWSLGIVFYELFFGVSPFEDVSSIEELSEELRSTEPIRFPPSRIDPYLVSTVKLMLNRNYKQRVTAKEAYSFVGTKFE